MNNFKFTGITPRSLSLAIATALLSLINPWLTTTAVQASTFAYEGFDYEPEDRDNSLLNGLPGQSGLDGGLGGNFWQQPL